MSFACVRKIAFRYLRPTRKEGFVSLIAGFSFLGIMLGVATLIIVMSVMNGFREDLFSRILGFNGHIAVTGLTRKGFQDYDNAVEKIKTLEGIVSATPVVEGQSMIMKEGTAFGVLVHGIKQEDLKQREIISNRMIMGSLDDFSASDAVVIGRRLAEKFNAVPGDTLTLVAPQGNPTAFGIVPRLRKVRVVGVFDVGMRDYDTGVIFMPLSSAQKFYRLPDAVSGIEIFVKDPRKIHQLTPDVIHAVGESARVIDWQKANEKYAVAVEVERNVMFTILTLIILVASFNIISSLIMLVKDKVQDIAILRTMGATQGTIMAIFFMAGSTIGCVGIVAGAILGISFASNIDVIRKLIEKMLGTNLFSAEIYFLSKLPAKIDFYEVMFVLSIAFVLVVLASLYPSWRAARLDPVEALRYE